MCSFQETAGKIHKIASVLETLLLDQLIPTAHGIPLPKHLNMNMLTPSMPAPWTFSCVHKHGSIHLEPLSLWQQGQTPVISWTRTSPILSKRIWGWSREQQRQKWNHLLWLYPVPDPEQHTALEWGSWFLLSPYDPANNHCIWHECGVRG